MAGHNEFSIEQIADITNTSVRNIRAYQDKGLLPMPIKRGRVAVYSNFHVARLRIVAHLLAKGYSLNNIAELMQVFAAGLNLDEFLGVDEALANALVGSPRKYANVDAFKMVFTPAASDEQVMHAADLGFIELQADGSVETAYASLLDVGALLGQHGMALDTMLLLGAHARTQLDRFVQDTATTWLNYLFITQKYSDQALLKTAKLALAAHPMLVSAIVQQVSVKMAEVIASELAQNLESYLLNVDDTTEPAT